MKTMTLYYPGDPPQQVEEMSRQEFLAAHPRTPIVVMGLDGSNRQEFPLGADDIFCDACDEDPGDTVYLVGSSRAYCSSCYNSNLKRHVR